MYMDVFDLVFYIHLHVSDIKGALPGLQVSYLVYIPMSHWKFTQIECYSFVSILVVCFVLVRSCYESPLVYFYLLCMLTFAIVYLLCLWFCSHYFVHGGWFPENNYLLDNVDKIRHLPATIVQGRYDVVTPMKTAWELHKVITLMHEHRLHFEGTYVHCTVEPCCCKHS